MATRKASKANKLGKALGFGTQMLINGGILTFEGIKYAGKQSGKALVDIGKGVKQGMHEQRLKT